MQLNKFKVILQKEKEDILLFIKNHHGSEIDHDGDETDTIQARIIQRTNAQLLAKKQEKLNRIDAAMKRIEAGEYGSCEECGEDIATKRLLINPGFNLCISCAERLDMVKKRQQH